MIRPELKIATTTKYHMVDGRIPAGTRVVISAFRVHANFGPRFNYEPDTNPHLEARVEEPKELCGWWNVRDFAFWAGEQKIEKGE